MRKITVCWHITVQAIRVHLYITALCKKILNRYRKTLNVSTMDSYNNRKGQLWKYSQILPALSKLCIHTSHELYKTYKEKNPFILALNWALSDFSWALKLSTKLGQIISDCWIAALIVGVTIYCKMVATWQWNAL